MDNKVKSERYYRDKIDNIIYSLCNYADEIGVCVNYETKQLEILQNKIYKAESTPLDANSLDDSLRFPSSKEVCNSSAPEIYHS